MSIRQRETAETQVYCRSESVQSASYAMASATVSRLKTLDPGFDYEVPIAVQFLRDTTPRARQWKREKNYYGESLHGTDWPDRWVVSFIPAA